MYSDDRIILILDDADVVDDGWMDDERIRLANTRTTATAGWRNEWRNGWKED